MSISTQSIILAERDFSKRISSGKRLKPGNRLRGRVLNIQKNGKLVMDFGNFRALARANFPVNRHETLHVKLLEDGARLRFELIRSKNDGTRRADPITSRFNIRVPQELRHFETEINKVISTNASLPETTRLPKEVVEALLKVSTYLAPLRLNGNKSDIIRQLRNHTENSGLFLEKKLEQSLRNLTDLKSIESLKHPIQFPTIKKILSNDLKSVLGPLKEYFNSGTAGTHLPIDARNTIEALLAHINTSQRSAVESTFRPASANAFTYDSLRITRELTNILLRFNYLISALSEKIKVYRTSFGGTVEKELENASIKISASAKVIRETLFSYFERPAKRRGEEGTLRPILMKKNPEAGKAMQQTPGAGTASRITPALPVKNVLEDILVATSAQQHQLFGPIRHLAELIAGLTPNQDISSASKEHFIQEKAVKPAASPNIVQAMNQIERLSLLSKPEQQTIPLRLLAVLLPGQDTIKPVNPGVSLNGTFGTNQNNFVSPFFSQLEQGHIPGPLPTEGAVSPNANPDLTDASVISSSQKMAVNLTDAPMISQAINAESQPSSLLSGPPQGSIPSRLLTDLAVELISEQKVSGISKETPSQEKTEGMRTSPYTAQTINQAGLSPVPTPQMPPLILLQQLLTQTADGKMHQESLSPWAEEPLEEETHDLTSANRAEHSKQWAGLAGVSRMLHAELIPALLKLEDSLNTNQIPIAPVDQKKKESLLKSVKDLLSNLKNFQRNDVQRETTADQVQVFAYDFLIKENEQRARLKIFHPKKEKSGKNGFRASLLLSMDKIGDIKADFFLLKNNLNITFFVKDLSIKTIIEKNLYEVIPQIDKTVEVLTVKVKVSEKAVEQFDTEWNDIPSNRIIDLKI